VTDLVAQRKPIETCGGEDDSVEPPLSALAEAGVDVPTQRLDGQPGLEREQL
jgi:hypothetical protein